MTKNKEDKNAKNTGYRATDERLNQLATIALLHQRGRSNQAIIEMAVEFTLRAYYSGHEIAQLLSNDSDRSCNMGSPNGKAALSAVREAMAQLTLAEELVGNAFRNRDTDGDGMARGEAPEGSTEPPRRIEGAVKAARPLRRAK